MASTHKRRACVAVLPTAGVLIVGIGLTLLSFGTSRDREFASITEIFVRDARDRITAIKQMTDEPLEVLKHLKALYASSEAVTWDEFGTFAASLLADTAGVEALEWIPPRSLRGTCRL